MPDIVPRRPPAARDRGQDRQERRDHRDHQDHQDHQDLGLFGPGSVTWRVHSEPILLLAGLRALFLQALHPRALAGVVQNSTFRTDPWGRLVRTVNFVATAIYGSTAQAEAAGRRVRRVHAGLTATDPVTGERFRIGAPELLRWVHVTEVDSYADTARRAGLRLSPAEWDRYWLEQRRIAALVGLDPDGVPGSTAEAADYYRAVRPELAMTRETASALLFLAAPPPPWQPGSGWRGAVLDRLGRPSFRLAFLGVSATAFGLLPDWARRLYGTAGLPPAALGATASARTLRLVLNRLPRRVYEDPLYRSAMARAAAASGCSAAEPAVKRAANGTAVTGTEVP